MEQLTIPLNQPVGPSTKRFRILQAFNACCFLLLAFVRSQLDWFALILGLYGFLLLLTAAFWPKIAKHYQLIVDDQGIRGQISWRDYIDLRWEHIAKAELGILFLELHTTHGKTHDINLGNLTY